MSKFSSNEMKNFPMKRITFQTNEKLLETYHHSEAIGHIFSSVGDYGWTEFRNFLVVAFLLPTPDCISNMFNWISQLCRNTATCITVSQLLFKKHIAALAILTSSVLNRHNTLVSIQRMPLLIFLLCFRFQSSSWLLKSWKHTHASWEWFSLSLTALRSPC